MFTPLKLIIIGFDTLPYKPWLLLASGYLPLCSLRGLPKQRDINWVFLKLWLGPASQGQHYNRIGFSSARICLVGRNSPHGRHGPHLVLTFPMTMLKMPKKQILATSGNCAIGCVSCWFQATPGLKHLLIKHASIGHVQLGTHPGTYLVKLGES